jgi:hypothetical protein
MLYRVGGTCGGLQSTPPNYLTIILLPITTPVLQSLQYTEYSAVCRRPFSFEAHFELLSPTSANLANNPFSYSFSGNATIHSVVLVRFLAVDLITV